MSASIRRARWSWPYRRPRRRRAGLAGLYRLGVSGHALGGGDPRRRTWRGASRTRSCRSRWPTWSRTTSRCWPTRPGAAYLASDPLGDGWNIRHRTRDDRLRVVSATAIWYVQVAALVIGHVAGLILAHDRALVSSRTPAATRSQYWMLAVMIAFTSLGLGSCPPRTPERCPSPTSATGLANLLYVVPLLFAVVHPHASRRCRDRRIAREAGEAGEVPDGEAGAPPEPPPGRARRRARLARRGGRLSPRARAARCRARARPA